MGAGYAVSEGGRYRAIKRVLPPSVVFRLLRMRARLRLLFDYVYDAQRFLRASALCAVPRNAAHYEALVTMNYHRIEKGLSLPQPKPFFGEVPICELLSLLREYGPRYPAAECSGVAMNALSQYLHWHVARGLNSPFLDRLRAGLAEIRTSFATSTLPPRGGTEVIATPPVALSPELRDRVLRERRSVRDFSVEPVAVDLVESAVALALSTPSVCNRQAWRVRCLLERETIDKALRYQNGNRGFGHTADKLLVVTCRLGAFVSSGERNQGWIDGGMFSMSLLTALHMHGLASCPLNWSVDSSADAAFRNAFAIPFDEIVIMMIAVGHHRATYSVCQSPRLPVREVISYI